MLQSTGRRFRHDDMRWCTSFFVILLSLWQALLIRCCVLQRGIAPLGPSVPTQPLLLGHGVGPPGHRPLPRAWGRGVAPPARHPWPRAWGVGYLLLAATPDLRRRVAPLGHSCAVAVWYSWPLPLTLDVG